MSWHWSRVLQVVGLAAMVAGGFCFYEATMPPRLGGYGAYGNRFGARPTPFRTCLRRDAPAVFLLAAASLTWITRNKDRDRE